MSEPASGTDPVQSWRLGMRLARKRASRSFGTVLALIVVSLVFAASASDAPWTTSVLLVLGSLTFVAALWTSGLARADSRLSLSVLLLALAVAILAPIVSGSTVLAISALLTGLVLLGTVGVIARTIARESEIKLQTVLGAICIYILLGMVFLFLYGAVALLASGPFFAQGTDGTRALRLYFSYVTIATLGYGDYTPRTNLGHMLAILEALLGQLYLVTVLALLVARVRIRKDS